MTPENLLSRIGRLEKSGSDEKPGGIVMVEIDRFRQLRGQQGFRAVFRLVRQVRKDLVSHMDERGEVHRFGLSGFIMIMPAVDADELQAMAEEIFASLSQSTFDIGNDAMAISASMAVAKFDLRFAGPDRLLVIMAERLEQIMADGGNQLAFVEPGVSANLALDSEEHMLGLLMDALRSNRLKVVFQPLLATSPESDMRSFQMLPRLRSSDGHLIPAAEFIPIARTAKLLPVLDRWMITHAVKLFRGPLKSQSVRLFINQSDALLSENERLEWLIDTLRKSAELNGNIVIELRLEDAMAHMKHTAQLIGQARDHGAAVCLSMVDEHSRWDLLAGKLECEFLRMSPGFVTHLATEPDLEKRFLEISKPLRDSGTRIIVPMIEDQKTAASMWRTGADFMQGNMIQEPEDTISLED